MCETLLTHNLASLEPGVLTETYLHCLKAYFEIVNTQRGRLFHLPDAGWVLTVTRSQPPSGPEAEWERACSWNHVLVTDVQALAGVQSFWQAALFSPEPRIARMAVTMLHRLYERVCVCVRVQRVCLCACVRTCLYGELSLTRLFLQLAPSQASVRARLHASHLSNILHYLQQALQSAGPAHAQDSQPGISNPLLALRCLQMLQVRQSSLCPRALVCAHSLCGPCLYQ